MGNAKSNRGKFSIDPATPVAVSKHKHTPAERSDRIVGADKSVESARSDDEYSSAGLSVDLRAETTSGADESAAGARSRSREPVTPIKLYYFPPSAPCRAVMMAARAVGIELDLQLTNIMEGAHLTPEFIKMNPQHTIPTIDDSGFILWESRAIMAYFVNAYGKDDSLYPKNPRQRALVDSRLNFDVGTLYKRYFDLYVPVLFFGAEMDPELMKKMDEALGWLETMLAGRAFVAGDNLTIADISILPTLTNLNVVKYELSPYPLVNAWFERTKLALEPFGYTEIDHAGGQILASFVNKG